MSEDTLEVERKGWKAKLRGRDPFPYLIIICLLIGVGYLTTFSLGKWGEPFSLRESFQMHEKEMNTQHSNYINGVAELTYVMSVCLNSARAEECKKLRLAMPDSLYRKLNSP